MLYYLSLGSNLGNREATIQRALHLLGCSKWSSFYYSEPLDFESTHAFCNCAAVTESELDPFEFLHFTQQIERELGRERKSANGKHFDRTIDIDILFTEPKVSVETDELTLPHKEMNHRSFVKVPLSELFS